MNKSKIYFIKQVRFFVFLIFALCNVTGVFSQNITQIKKLPVVLSVCGSFPNNNNTIEAVTSITTAVNCNTTIMADNSTVNFISGKSIVLSPGFKALNGSKFIASINPVSGSAATVSENATTSNININNTTNISVIPNPFGKVFLLSVNAIANNRAEINIYNSIGVKIKLQTNINLVKGSNTIFFDMSNFAADVYMLEVNMDGNKIVKKIIKD